MSNHTTRMELNIRQSKSAPSDVLTLGNFAAKNKFPAVVVDPEYLTRVLLERVKYQGKYKVIMTIDSDNGKRYGMEKFRPLPKSMFDADGYDVQLTPGMSESESLNEMRVISKFIKDINPLKEIRWTLGLIYRQPESVYGILPNIKSAPCEFVRTDFNLESVKIDLNKHEEIIKLIKNYCATPIKISGNVNLEVMNKFGLDGFRYDVTTTQARNIIAEIETSRLNKMKGVTNEVDAGVNKTDVRTVNLVAPVVIAGETDVKSN